MNITIVSGSNHEGSTTLRLCKYIQSCLESEGFSVRLWHPGEIDGFFREAFFMADA